MGYYRPVSGREFRLEGLVRVNIPERRVLLEDIRMRLASGIGFSLATVNLDHLVKLRRSARFRDAYEKQTHVVADGNPVVWVSRLAGRPVELVPGSDLVLPLAAVAAQAGVSLALVGATAETLDRAAQVIAAAEPDLDIVARIAPAHGFDPEGEEADRCIEALRESGAGMCILALGAPRQEIFAVRAQAALPACGFASLGAGLDFIAGTQKRAPRWVRRLALEWIWRMLSNPRRLARRYFDSALILPRLALAALRSRRAGAGPTG